MFVFPKTRITKTKNYSLKDIEKVNAYHTHYEELLQEERRSYENYSILNQRMIKKYCDSFSMKLKRNRLGLYICEVKIQNQNLRFLIDTGAQISGLMKKSAEKLNAKVLDEKMTVGSIGGKAKNAKCIVIPNFFFGAIEICNQPFVVMDDHNFYFPFVNVKMMNFDGIIGWDILSQFDFELDDAKQVFSVLGVKIKSDVKNFIPASFPCIILKDEWDNPVIFGFDSGAKESWLAKKYIERNDMEVQKEQKAVGMGVLGMEVLDFWLAKQLELYLEDTKISLHNIMSGRVDMFQSIKVDGVLGAKIFKGKKIQIFPSKGYIRII